MPAALLFLLKLLGGEVASRGALHLAGKLGSRAIAGGVGKKVAEQAAKYGTKQIAGRSVGELGRGAGSIAKHALIAGPAFIGADTAISNLFEPAEPYGADSLAGPTRTNDDREVQDLIRALQSTGGDEEMGDEHEVMQLLESMPNVRMLYA